MKYLNCVFHETLRIYQPANGIFFREAQYDHYLNDVPIKKGTVMALSSLSCHYNEKNFENPFEFIPERWEKGEGNNIMVPKPYSWLPFSAGARSCIGQHLA